MKILAIRLSSLGDVVLATAALDALRRLEPGARITFLTKAAYAPLLRGHPSVDEVWALDGQGPGPMQVRARRFDAVLDLHGGLRSTVLALFSGARVVRAKGYRWNRRLRVLFPGFQLRRPPDVALRGVEAAGRLLGRDPGPAIPLPTLRVQPEAEAWAGRFLAEAGWTAGQTLVGISPGAAWATKRWNPGYFAQAMGLLADSDKIRFLYLGSEAERPVSASIISYARKGGPQAINAAGRTDVVRLAALIARCQVLLTPDSGPMHVATALGVPVVALFGPTVEDFGFFPRGPRDKVLQVAGLSCRPCSVHGGAECPIRTHACMEMLAPFDVAAAVREFVP